MEIPKPLPQNDLDDLTRLIHLGLAVLGIAALVSGLFAGDYKRMAHLGFSYHRWLGISLSFLMFYRIWLGFYGRQANLFREWVPYTPERLRWILADLVGLLRLKLPDRPTHGGLAGVVQTFGLAVFSWMAATGTLMFFFLEPGRKARWSMDFVKELHEAGLWLMVIFLAIHVAAVVLHALAGDQSWRRAFFLDRLDDQ
jgi:cytochrome b561